LGDGHRPLITTSRVNDPAKKIGSYYIIGYNKVIDLLIPFMIIQWFTTLPYFEQIIELSFRFFNLVKILFVISLLVFLLVPEEKVPTDSKERTK
jgi:hypothetical protein